MATREFSLEGFNKGQFLSWFITTQAANNITVKIFDSKTTYVNASKRSINISPPLAIGSSIINGDNLKLVITSEPSQRIDAWFNNMKISSASTAKTVGEYFVLAGEDQVGGDEDYNDICISLTSWNSKG